MLHRLTLVLFIGVLALWAADYDGPRPPKPDLPYLVHADNLIPTESGDAKQEKDTYVVSGATSSARTPLAEPIFIIQADRLSPDSIELYRMEVKNGHREVTPGNGKRRGGGRPLHLQVTKLDRNLYRIEAAETLENGEYSLSPNGSNKVFCFEVY